MSQPPRSIHPRFLSQVNSRWRFRLFLWSKLPLAAFAGVRMESISDEAASVSLKMGWRTQNPFRSIYFAALSMAAELTTGMLGYGRLYGLKPSVSMLLLEQSGEFYKKAVGRVVFTCSNGAAIGQAIEGAQQTDEGQMIECISKGVNEDGVVVATFRLVWSFKARGGNNG